MELTLNRSKIKTTEDLPVNLQIITNLRSIRVMCEEKWDDRFLGIVHELEPRFFYIVFILLRYFIAKQWTDGHTIQNSNQSPS